MEDADGRRPAIITTDERDHHRVPSEGSMANDEKVRSFLSALPNTDMEGALTGTPLHAPRHSFLQVPQSSPPKARSLQATVEDCDTPRKPTQETVIRHTSAISEKREQDAVRCQIAELQSQLLHQEQASRTRITELETILSYTRTELEGARTDNYHHKDALASLKRTSRESATEQQAAHALTDFQKQSREDAFVADLRLQTQAKLNTQKEDFDRELAKLCSVKHLTEQKLFANEQMMRDMQKELAQLKLSNNAQIEDVPESSCRTCGGLGFEEKATTNKKELQTLEQLSAVQARAEQLQCDFEGALAEARAAREEAQQETARRIAAEESSKALMGRVISLEHNLQAARFEIECAQADVAAKQQLFNVNIDLNARLRALHSHIETSRMTQATGHQEISNNENLEQRIISSESQLNALRADMAKKEQQIASYVEAQEQADRQNNISKGRIEGLEANYAVLRQQLAECHRESARARTEVERYQHELEIAEDSLREAQADANRRVADAEKRLGNVKEAKLDVETKYKSLQAQHDDLIEGHEAMVKDLRERTEDAVRKAGVVLEQERSDKRRLLKDLKNVREEMNQLRTDGAQRLAEEDSSSEDNDKSSHSSRTQATETEVQDLRQIIRRQIVDVKTMKSEMAALKKENKKLKQNMDMSLEQQATITELHAQIGTLQSRNSLLELRITEQRADFEAINKAMDEKLAVVVSKVMKERARLVVGKRDGQWVERVGKVHDEKELLGKVLLRQWGREEVGIADESHGEKQGYAYKYIQR